MLAMHLSTPLGIRYPASSLATIASKLAPTGLYACVNPRSRRMQIMHRLKHGLLQAAGWLFYLSLLMGLAMALPVSTFDSESKDFIFLIGAVGIWRYSMGATHFVRGMIFLYIVYPHLRRKVRKLGKAADPSHVFLMVTSFRIDALTTAQVYSSVIREAIDCDLPTTVVCSIVEMSDELLVKSLWNLSLIHI